MLSRRHLRIKALQSLYAFFLTENTDLRLGESVLSSSLDKLHELLILQLSLIPEIRDLAKQKLEDAMGKFLPTPEELNPNRRFVDNVFLIKLEENLDYQKYYEKYKINWVLDQEIIKKLFFTIRDSKEYLNYLNSDDVSYAFQADFIHKIFKKFIAGSEMLADFYEDKSIFWAGDYALSAVLAQKVVNHLTEDSKPGTPLPTLIKTQNEVDNEDLVFLLELFRKTILHSSEYEALFTPLAKNWDFERIAIMDTLIIKMAICELLEFPSIPVKVTLDEYIEISKSFSTPKSSQFINGILDKLVIQLKEEKKIIKRGRGLKE